MVMRNTDNLFVETENPGIQRTLTRKVPRKRTLIGGML